MPFYRFLLHGSGQIALAPGRRCAGSYTTRWAFAPNEKLAAAKAIRSVRREWLNGDLKGRCDGGAPEVTIEEGYPIAAHQIGEAPNKGYTFYSAEK